MLYFEIVATIIVTMWIVSGVASTVLLCIYDVTTTKVTCKDYLCMTTIHLLTGGFFTVSHVVYCFQMNECEYILNHGHIAILG